MTDTVGLVGLGFIGASIGERLLVTGEAPLVLDVVPDRVEALVARGAVAAGSARDLAARCDVVLVCVQTDEQCLDLVTGPDGLLSTARPGSVIAVLSTISPHTIDALAAAAGAAASTCWRCRWPARGRRAWPTPACSCSPAATTPCASGAGPPSSASPGSSRPGRSAVARP